MKKLFLVLALVSAYGVSMAISSSNVILTDKSQVTIVAVNDDNNVAAPEIKKEEAKTKEAKPAKSEGCAGAKSEGCATAKSEGCGTAKSAGCGEKAKTESTDKKEGSK